MNITTSLKALFFGIYCVTFALATVRLAHATLGESADPAVSDRKGSSSVRHAASNRSSYTVREVKSGANVMREYISPAGVVFAIAWNGVSHPDLASQLGTYTDEYKKALQQTPGKRGTRHLQVKADRVIVEKWGHMRNMHGRAYVPSLIPSGVSIDEIK